MALAEFKNVAAVLEKFKIKYQEQDFIAATDFDISPAFLNDFNFVRDHIDVKASEYAICESIIYPILKEVYKKYAERLALWSHRSISYGDELAGVPDYLLATKSALGKVVLGQPLLLVVEAKKNNFEEGWGQCLAGMVMAQAINKDPSFTIYGIVSDGEVWQFGKLLASEFTSQRTFFTLNDLRRLFGAIDYVMASLDQALDRMISKSA